MKKSNHSRRLAKQKEKTRKEDDVNKDDEKSKSRKGQMQKKSLCQQYTQESSDDDQEEPLFSLAHRLKDGYIPDAHMIHAARKKREIARQLGTAGD